MATNAAMSNGRRLAASGALIATAAGVAAIGLHDLRWIEWSLVASSAVLGVAGVGLARRSMVGQVLSRAAAWLVFAPAAVVTVVSTFVGNHPDLTGAALAVGSGAALFLARPMLNTPEARAEFAPSRFRSWLLAGATASTATGMLASFIGLDALSRAWAWSGSYDSASALLVLGIALIASAYGVVRLRAWGILLGALTSFLTLATAAFMHDAAGLALSLAAIPGLLFFVLPVLIAQRDRAKADRSINARIASYEAASLPARVRIGTDDADPYADEFEAEESSHSTPPPAARAQHV
jgi:hypothetical protein